MIHSSSHQQPDLVSMENNSNNTWQSLKAYYELNILTVLHELPLLILITTL